jgi:hypothetical protein
MDGPHGLLLWMTLWIDPMVDPILVRPGTRERVVESIGPVGSQLRGHACSERRPRHSAGPLSRGAQLVRSSQPPLPRSSTHVQGRLSPPQPCLRLYSRHALTVPRVVALRPYDVRQPSPFHLQLFVPRRRAQPSIILESRGVVATRAKVTASLRLQRNRSLCAIDVGLSLRNTIGIVLAHSTILSTILPIILPIVLSIILSII